MKTKIIKSGTRTSSFGSPGRINHDSSSFYASNLYRTLPKENHFKYEENSLDPENLDKIFCKSSEGMTELPDKSVHLMVTSPPYNVGKEYDENYTLEDYLVFLKKVWVEVRRVLVPGGRVAINVANLGRKPYIPLHAYIVKDMTDLGFLMRGEIIWNKASSASPSTAWGSWCSASNPTLRDVHEYILIFSKDVFSRKNVHKRPNSITRDSFMEFTKSIWTFSAESARKIGHPAPFPVELPLRIIELYTFKGDVVLDPFMGSGQTAIAAVKTGRHYIGYDIDQNYVDLANKRIDAFQQQQSLPKILE
jgi:site-specific DNA-methyltransferase (adenine-specific)